MKNKKLFAILTLVCFMFTLMPVAAFADPAVTDYVGVAATAKDGVSVKVNEKLAVNVFDKDGNGKTTSSFYYWAEDADENVVLLGEGTDGNEFTFEDVETVYVYAVEKDGPGKVATVFGNAVATPDEIVDVIKARYAKLIVDDALEVKVKKADTVYSLAVTTAPTAVKANDNWTEVEATVQLMKNTTTPVKNADIEFSADSAYVTIEKVERTTTDRNGEQVIRITAAKAGSFVIYADYEDADTLEIAVTVNPDDITVIKTVAEPARGVALDSSFATGLRDIGFEIATEDGTLLDSSDAASLIPTGVSANYKITVVEAPEDSNIDETALVLAWDTENDRWMLQGATSLDEEGTYKFKVALKDGNAATASVKVVEFDKPVMMILTMNDNTVALVDGVATSVKSVSFLDKNGTVLSASHPDYTDSKLAGARTIVAGVPTYANLDFAGTGKALKDVDAKTGVIQTVDYTTDTKAYVGSKVTIVVVNDALEMTASADLTVVNKAAGLKYESTTADIAVNNKLIVNVVDEDGNVVSAGLDTTEVLTTPSVYVLSAPANAAYSVDASVTDADEVTVTFTASAAGEYKLQTIVRNNGEYYSSVDTIVVGGTAGQFKDVVVMSIGANNIVVNSDVKAIAAAPMIQDNRTFVPFRALAEAFGADVEWVEATQSVVAELNGVKVVMNIGENAYTVNGAAKTADVAPFINGASTMVPVRFVAEAFGINVTPIYAENGAVADVLFAK